MRVPICIRIEDGGGGVPPWLTGAPESWVAITLNLSALAGLDLAVRF